MKGKCRGIIGTRTVTDGSAQTAAFSRADLVTLLAVCCVIGVLGLTAAGNTRVGGDVAQCLSNHRMLVRALMMYAEESRGKLPGNVDGGDAIEPRISRSWCFGWLDITGPGSPAGSNTNTLLLKQGQLAPYLAEDYKVFKCPADESVGVYGGKAYPRVRSVSMNSYLGDRASPYTSGYRQYRKLAEIVSHPLSRLLVFIDEREDSINDPAFMIDMNGYDPRAPASWRIVDYPADWHERGAALSFVDGHAEAWHWRDIRTTPKHRWGTYLPLNMSSPDNPDVERLQNAASRNSLFPTRP